MQQLRSYSPQWLHSTCFGRQSHPSSGVYILYMATGKLAHLGCKFLLDVSVVNSPIVVELLVITALFCVVLPYTYTAYVLLMMGEIVARNM